MILCDANLLLYAYNASAPEHPKARVWLENRLSSPSPFALSWSTIGAFLRLATHRAIFPAPYSIAEATRIADAWLGRPMVVVLEPGPEESNARGSLVADALLAALALEHGATLATHDLDFRRFEGLSLLDPVAA
ncbi:MAG: vapC [Acidobacteria bacterium]|nr:vapC [Acidobacteriota bacterium]